MWKIPLFDIDFDGREIEAVLQVIRSRWLTMGEITERFEQQFAGFMNVKHAIAVSNCTVALHLANLSLGIGRGDEVICPSLTFVAGANSIIHTGAKPIFAEIMGFNNFNISPDDIETKISERTKAIQVVHYAGYPCEMDSIMEIANSHGLSVIEDCAHTPGAEYKNKKCGAIGDIGCFSFFSNKNMTVGEGGMITTNSDELAKKIRLLRSHGMTTLTLDRHQGRALSYDVLIPGFNYRIDEIRSAIGIIQLEKLQKNNVRREELTLIFRKRLADIPNVSVPFDKIEGVSSYHIFPILLDRAMNRSKFMVFMRDKGVQSSIHYPPIHLFDFYRRKFNYNDGFLAVTEEVGKREVTLPLYPSMRDEDVHYVCDVIIEYIKKEEDKQ